MQQDHIKKIAKDLTKDQRDTALSDYMRLRNLSQNNAARRSLLMSQSQQQFSQNDRSQIKTTQNKIKNQYTQVLPRIDIQSPNNTNNLNNSNNTLINSKTQQQFLGKSKTSGNLFHQLLSPTSQISSENIVNSKNQDLFGVLAQGLGIKYNFSQLTAMHQQNQQSISNESQVKTNHNNPIVNLLAKKNLSVINEKQSQSFNKRRQKHSRNSSGEKQNQNGEHRRLQSLMSDGSKNGIGSLGINYFSQNSVGRQFQDKLGQFMNNQNNGKKGNPNMLLGGLQKSLIVKLKKEELSQLDKTQVMYLQVVHALIDKSLNYFTIKLHKKAHELLKQVIHLGHLANDFNLLMKLHNLIGVLLLNKRDFLAAIAEFRILRDMAEEVEQDRIRLLAYSLLGSCYQFMKEYENAIKCFKKQLEISWSKGDYAGEMNAYDKIAINYFYLSDLDKAKYYQERMMRGQFEGKKSKLRKIYEAQQKNRKAERSLWGQGSNSAPLTDSKSLFQQLEEVMKEQKDNNYNLENGLIRINVGLSGKTEGQQIKELKDELFRVIIQQNLEPELDEISKEEFQVMSQQIGQVDAEFMNYRKERMFLVRAGTPISEIDPDELPSPRYDAKKKKIKVLPHYSEKLDDNKKGSRVAAKKPYEDKNLREILDLLYKNRNHKAPTFVPKKDYDGPSISSVDQLKNSEILKKARMARNANVGQISINHLSPIRIENNFKDIEYTNNQRCKDKFKTIEIEIEQDIDGVNHQTFKVNDVKQLQAVIQNNENRLVNIGKKSMQKASSNILIGINNNANRANNPQSSMMPNTRSQKYIKNNQ